MTYYLLFRVEPVIILGLGDVNSELCFFAYDISGDSFEVFNLDRSLTLFVMNVKYLGCCYHEGSVLGPLVLINLFDFVAENNFSFFTDLHDFWLLFDFQKIVVD